MGIDIVVLGSRGAEDELGDMYDLSPYKNKQIDSLCGVSDVEDALGWIDVLVDEQWEDGELLDVPLIIHITGEGAREVAEVVLCDADQYPNVDIMVVTLHTKSECF